MFNALGKFSFQLTLPWAHLRGGVLIFIALEIFYVTYPSWAHFTPWAFVSCLRKISISSRAHLRGCALIQLLAWVHFDGCAYVFDVVIFQAPSWITLRRIWTLRQFCSVRPRFLFLATSEAFVISMNFQLLKTWFSLTLTLMAWLTRSHLCFACTCYFTSYFGSDLLKIVSVWNVLKFYH